MTAQSQPWQHFGSSSAAWSRRPRQSGFRCLATLGKLAPQAETEPAAEPDESAPIEELGPQLDRLLERHLATSSAETLETLQASFRSLLGLSPVLGGEGAESNPDWLELKLTTLAGTLDAVETRLSEVQGRLTGERKEAARVRKEAPTGAALPVERAAVPAPAADEPPRLRAPLRREFQLEQLVADNVALRRLPGRLSVGS